MNAIHSNAVVIGAGLAGLTTGITLARAGRSVVVLESCPELRTGGYKVDVRGVGLTVLDRLGLLDVVRAHHLGIRAGSIVTADGSTVAQLGGDTFGGREGGDVEVERGVLLTLLADAARAAGAEFRFGARVLEAGEGMADGGDGDRPWVRLAGGEMVRAEVVVGADGLHSAVRRAVVGDVDVVRDLGHGIAVHATVVNPGLDREEATYVAPGRTALVYDTGEHTRAMYLFTREGEVPRGRGAAAYLKEAYAGQGWVVPELLAGLDDDSDLYLDAMAQVVAPTWSRGRVVLVGDAAWCASPASGQGTSLGLVGGYVLGARLAVAGAAEVPGALAAYEEGLRRFVERNQALGPANLKRMVLASEKSVRSTLRLLRVMGRMPLSDFLMRQAMRPLHRAAGDLDLDAAAGHRA